MEKGTRPLEEIGKFFGGLIGDAVESAKIAAKALEELPSQIEEAGKDISEAFEQGYNEGLMVTPDNTEESDVKDSPSQS